MVREPDVYALTTIWKVYTFRASKSFALIGFNFSSFSFRI